MKVPLIDKGEAQVFRPTSQEVLSVTPPAPMAAQSSEPEKAVS